MSPDDPATAEGDLHRTPLPHLLVYMADRRLTGALFLKEPSGVEHLVRFEWGAPARVVPGDAYALFGQLLVEAGIVTEEVVQEALATKGLLGDVLILTGHADSIELERTAVEQLTRRVVHLFGLPPATSYRYFDGHPALANTTGPPCRSDPLALLLAGLREHPRAGLSLARLMEKLGEARLRLHADAVLERFCLTDEEASVATALLVDKPTFVDLVASGVAPPDVVCRIVYVMLITRQIDLGQKLPPLGADDTPPPVAVGRVMLMPAVHRLGAAAPDPAGDGERAAVLPRTLRRRKAAGGVVSSPESDEDPISDVTEPTSDVVEVGGPTSRARAGQGS